MKKANFKNIKVKILSQKCPKHGVPLISHDYVDKKHNINIHIKPFCPECEREKMDQERANLTKKFQYQQVHGFLRAASLLDRSSTFNCTFDSFKTPDNSTAAVKQYGLTLAKLYTSEPEKEFNSVFSGKSGAGKTHLAMAILNYVNDHSNQKCLFLSVPKLLEQCRAYIGDKMNNIWSPQFIENILHEANLVVIDDLGAESKGGNATDFVANTLFNIYESNQRIITTTNLSVPEIKATYGERMETRITEHGRGHIISFNQLRNVRQF